MITLRRRLGRQIGDNGTLRRTIGLNNFLWSVGIFRGRFEVTLLFRCRLHRGGFVSHRYLRGGFLSLLFFTLHKASSSRVASRGSENGKQDRATGLPLPRRRVGRPLRSLQCLARTGNYGTPRYVGGVPTSGGYSDSRLRVLPGNVLRVDMLAITEDYSAAPRNLKIFFLRRRKDEISFHPRNILASNLRNGAKHFHPITDLLRRRAQFWHSNDVASRDVVTDRMIQQGL